MFLEFLFPHRRHSRRRSKREAAELKKKEALGQQSFNIVLGSLLGFPFASAVSHIGGGKE